ncbi:universal stress protein UspA [Halobiforma lacisalsi AJ5]|uniref:Universal stress protein UspA n=1 Tax=Natronobacterium lacisalsi AJ5 TaxID=358396 RepID=M0LI27_NATLA|nr:universal stress protein [Halobiforma lacisalsi]APW98500.1 universal stress protein UspA [Halobiforma lacisalsi AJ5]EMA33282.1 UspA domain-containing protein [Halobiforma lacisalsi AJ5]
MSRSTSILVPHDGSGHAQSALEYALETFPDGRIVLFHAIDPFERTDDEDEDEDEDEDGDGLTPLTEAWHENKREAASELFAEALEAVDVDPDDAEIETATAVGSPPQTIVGYVEDAEIDQVVMGSRGRSTRGTATDLRLGSTAEVVVRRVEIPVTVVR